MKFLLICEGTGDDDDLRALVWNAARWSLEWLNNHDGFEELGEWVEIKPDERFLKWSDINSECDRLRVPPVQRLGKGLGYQTAKRALNLTIAHPAIESGEDVRVVMVHDSDRVDGWLESILDARTEWLAEVPVNRAGEVDVAVGIAHPEHEAWAVALFDPRNDVEKERLSELRRELGFDPTRKPERLSSGRSTHPKDAKRVLRALVDGDAERRRALLRDAAIETALDRGVDCGLAAFIGELVSRAASAFGSVPRERLARCERALQRTT